MIKVHTFGYCRSTTVLLSTMDALCEFVADLAEGQRNLMEVTERRIGSSVPTRDFLGKVFSGESSEMRPLVTAARCFQEGMSQPVGRFDPTNHLLCAKMALLVGLGLTGRNTFYWGMKFDQLSDLVAAIKLAEESGLSFLEVVRTAA